MVYRFVVKFPIIIGCLLVAEPLWAAVHKADGSPADTQAKINAAVSGDTVQWPPSGYFRWNNGVSIPSTKGITLDLNGSTVARGAGRDPLVSFDNNSTAGTRITGGAFAEHTLDPM